MGNTANGVFSILGKFFFFYMVSGSAWTIYNKHMYGQSNVDNHSTAICVALSVGIVVAIELFGLVNRKERMEED